ncbi:MAG: enoyl-CoA hydratase/isomerase family protein [Deltaproteobacteria bacterium]|nr:enoyl-CoA hydratase/isomerase family protein [Deltaproteobacteria bacterium]
MADLILRERDGDVTTITLNRPEIGNRVSDAMAGQLADMIDDDAKESRLILLKGAGKNFCLGREAMGQRQPSLEAYALRGQTEVLFNCYDAFRRSKVPVIGVIQGSAVGFGCALAALCDITIASDKARFQLPEMAHNIMPTIAMSALVDRVPRKALMYLVYSTDEIDAHKALSFGLVSNVVPVDKLDPAVNHLIEAMNKYPLPALMAVKEYARSAYGMDTRAANDFARNLHATINSSSGVRP